MAKAMIVIRSAPSADLETVELALALAAFEHEISLVFLGAGLLWLLNNQQERKPGGKSPSKLVNALPIYDCESVYFSSADIERLKLDRSCINTVARELDPEEIQQLLAQQQFCLSF